MQRNSGSIEVLLLLCCMVGVVAFFSLSLALSNVLLEPATGEELSHQQQQLAGQLKERTELAQTLEAQKRALEQQLRARNTSTAEQNERARMHLDELQKQLAQLASEREQLQAEIDQVSKELGALASFPDPSAKEHKQKEIEELKRRLAELEQKIAQAGHDKQAVEQRAQTKAADAGIDNIEFRTREIAAVEENKRLLAAQIRELNMKLLAGGSSKFKKPLFVDCKENVLVFYPGQLTVPVAELDKRELIKEQANGHDLIVLFVRPDGFEGFRRAYAKAKALAVAVAYEPLSSDQNIDFMGG